MYHYRSQNDKVQCTLLYLFSTGGPLSRASSRYDKSKHSYISSSNGYSSSKGTESGLSEFLHKNEAKYIWNDWWKDYRVVGKNAQQ